MADEGAGQAAGLPDFADLIAELPRWNGGAGIAPEDWIGCVGNYELAIGYGLLFWPRFVEHEGYVLRHGFEERALRSVEACAAGDRGGVEALMNHVHIADLHANVATPPTEAQVRHLGRILKATHEAKLRLDFPGRVFTVSFNDEAGLPVQDYELSFRQVPSRD
jgi:hypothetical protein